MNDIVFNIDTMSFEFKLEFFVRFADVFFEAAVVPQNRHKFAVLILWALASAISIPRNTSITDVDMGRIQNMDRGPWTTPWTTPNFQQEIAPVIFTGGQGMNKTQTRITRGSTTKS